MCWICNVVGCGVGPILKMLVRLVSSKKAVAAITGAIIAATARIGLDLPADAVNQIIAPIVAYIVGQGMADFGKEKALVG